jgi:STE24 endopeptidase
MLARSRHNEYEADRFAVATTDKGDELVEALKKLAANNLSNLVPHPFYVVLNYSHPPVLDRIRAIHAMADDTATA